MWRLNATGGLRMCVGAGMARKKLAWPSAARRFASCVSRALPFETLTLRCLGVATSPKESASTWEAQPATVALASAAV